MDSRVGAWSRGRRRPFLLSLCWSISCCRPSVPSSEGMGSGEICIAELLLEGSRSRPERDLQIVGTLSPPPSEVCSCALAAIARLGVVSRQPPAGRICGFVRSLLIAGVAQTARLQRREERFTRSSLNKPDGRPLLIKNAGRTVPKSRLPKKQRYVCQLTRYV